METSGEQVYRLCSLLIQRYVNMFTSSEKDWEQQITKYRFFPSDFLYVSSLPTHELRIYFWLDKISVFTVQEFIESLMQLQGAYLFNSFWRVPPYIFSREESELFYLLHLYFDDSGGLQNLVPDLTRNVKEYFTVIGI